MAQQGIRSVQDNAVASGDIQRVFVDENRGVSVLATDSQLSPALMEDLSRLLPMTPGYQWFSQSNLEEAGWCFAALVRAHEVENDYLVQFSAGAIASLYNQDRAQRACSLLPDSVKPVDAIPTTFYRSGDTYTLKLKQLKEWDSQIPLSKLPYVMHVITAITPDALWLATYLKETRRDDPVIYAQYGTWYVKLVEWR